MLLEIKIKYLDWDSSFFGYKIGASEILPEFSYSDFLAVVEQAQAAGYKLVYLKSTDTISFLNKEKAANYKLILADERLTYIMPIERTAAFAAVAPNVQKYQATAPDKQLINLALQSGAYSRFAIDPNFKNQEYKKLYTAWITRILTKEIPEEIWVSTDSDNNLVGFGTVGFDQQEAYMGLMAINENNRQTGIAHSFIQTARIRAAQAACTTLRMVTQKANLPACRLYEKSGFVLSKTEYLYHLWLQ